MKIAKFVISIILIGTVSITGCSTSTTPSQLSIPSVSGEALLNPKLAIADYYQTTNLSLTPDAPSYPLPLDIKEISNFNDTESTLHLNASQKQLLEENGFVMIP